MLHPSYFGAQLEDYLRQKLYEDVEGTCSGKHGYLSLSISQDLSLCIHFPGIHAHIRARYIISVITITDIGEGKIIPSTGQAKFKTRYTAIVMKPFKGEVVDAKVVNVNKASLLFYWFHDRRLTVWQMGFFAMVGPLQVFVSCHVSRVTISLILLDPP